MSTRMTRAAYGLDVGGIDDNWRLRAACRGSDPHMWELTSCSRGTTTYKLAHRICHTCPVKQQCFDMAVATQSVGHIFGGVDFADRPKQAGQPTRIDRCPICSAHFVVVNNRHRYCSQRCRYIGETNSPQRGETGAACGSAAPVRCLICDGPDGPECARCQCREEAAAKRRVDR